MSGVKRWDHAVRWEGMKIAASYMAIKSGGKYVLASDYDACASRLREVAEICAIAEQGRNAPPVPADVVSVPVEMLERVISPVSNQSDEIQHFLAVDELHALLAQSESKGVKL